MLLPMSVCLFARLFRKLWTDFDENSWERWGVARKQLIRFWWHRITIWIKEPWIPEIFKEFFYYCASYRLRRIKRENFRRSFELYGGVPLWHQSIRVELLMMCPTIAQSHWHVCFVKLWSVLLWAKCLTTWGRRVWLTSTNTVFCLGDPQLQICLKPLMIGH